MKSLKKFKKNINYSYVMGRFSPQIGSRYQYFPIDNWQKDLKIAKKFKFDGTEWIVSDFSNPIFNEQFRKIIKKNLNTNRLKICSLSLDLIMDNPLHRIHFEDVDWLLKELKTIIKYFSIKRVTIPIEERSRFNNFEEKKIALKTLGKFCSSIGKITNLCVETDISPNSLQDLLNLKSFKRLGVLLDLGNTKAHGFNLADYINFFPKKIFGIHIKYRPNLYGKTERIKKKFNELSYLINNINKLKNCKDITFQTFKSKKNYLKDMQFSINNFNKHV